MEYRTLGKSDLKVSAITFGAWAIGGWMWGGTDMKEAIDAIHAGLDQGITSIDTAPVYGFGLSEQIVGEALKGKQRDKIQLFTKFGLRWDTDRGELHADTQDNNGKTLRVNKYAGKEGVHYECEQSLKRLRTDYIDLFQIHWPDPTTPIEETMEALILLKEQGKIREAAVCNYNVSQLIEAEKTLALVSNQIPYSMLQRDYEKQVVPYCQEHQMSILAYSPMQRGILTGKFTPEHQFNKGDHRATSKYFQPENIRRINVFLEKIRPIAEDRQATLAQLVLCWTIHQPGITVALAGARNREQAVQNAGAANIRLTDEEMKQINACLENLQLVDDKK